MRATAILTLFILLSSLLNAQTATIRGKVISGGSGDPLIGANILVLGTGKGASTDMDGRYSIKGISPGEHKIVCKYLSYKDDTIRGLKVEKGEVRTLDFTLHKSRMETEAVEIKGRKERSSDLHMMAKKRSSSQVMDGISAQQMSRSGAGNAAEAAQKVTGVSVKGGKYVYVRGLSDRYGKTMLNGMEVPGADPDRNSVQMDLFPSSILENMTIIKSYSPDLPANFTGGLVNLQTKDFPSELTFDYSSSIAFNPQANLKQDFLSQSQKKGDALALGAEARQVPQTVQNREVPGALFENDELLGRQTRSFSKDFAPVRRPSGLDQSHSLSLGNRKQFLGNSLGFVAGITYSRGFDHYTDGQRNIYQLPGPKNQEEGLSEQKVLEDERGEREVQWGAIADLTYKFSDHHKIGALFMRNQNGNSTARQLQGRIPEDAQSSNYRFHTRTQSYRQRSVQTLQIRGEHLFPSLSDLKVEWRGSRNRSTQKTPDLSYFSNTYLLSEARNGEPPDTSYSINPAEYSEPMRFYRNLVESNTDIKVDLTLPFQWWDRKAIVKGGISYTSKERDFTEQRYNFSSYNVPYNGNPDAYFSDTNMQVGDYQEGFVYMQDASALRNNYYGEQTISAAYLMTEFDPTEGLHVSTGTRVERTRIRTRSADPGSPQGKVNQTDLLPSLNLTYRLRRDMNLRGGYSRTIARPSFREFAPFPSFDFTGGLIRTGNEELDRTLVDNYDLRWELFPNPSEIISTSLFAKDFHRPIERVTKPKAAHTEITWQNVERATLYGAEIQARKSLSFIDSCLANVKIGANFTYIHSEVSIADERLKELRAYAPDHPDTRNMYGQAPYIVNAFLNYDNDELGLEGNLNLNVTGPRMVIVSQGGTPNVYDQPNPRLDLKVKKSLGERFDVGVQVENLLNPANRWTQSFAGKEYVFSSHRSGRRYSLSISYSIGD
ncbi:MAG: TonB-dependent receptor domain-containing protein [Flavobacteriales bacterium]